MGQILECCAEVWLEQAGPEDIQEKVLEISLDPRAKTDRIEQTSIVSMVKIAEGITKALALTSPLCVSREALNAMPADLERELQKLWLGGRKLYVLWERHKPSTIRIGSLL